MNAKPAILVLLGILVISQIPSPAVAAGEPYYLGYGYAPWDYYWRHNYVTMRNSMPYFALHPPVRYSYAVSRTYGLSPFAAYPAGVYDQVQPTPPLLVQNPYVSQTAVISPPMYGTGSPPLRIINPYVAKPGDPGVTPEAVLPRQPRVTYPSAVSEPNG